MRIISSNFNPNKENILAKIDNLFSRNQSTVIATHNGCFHADEACAIAIIKIYQKTKFKNSPEPNIIRTRSKDMIESADITLDVGLKYDENKLIFDHHQRDFEFSYFIQEFYSQLPEADNEIPYATAGMIWEIFGRSLLRIALEGFIKKRSLKIENEDKEIIISKSFENIKDFIFQIDATDTGHVNVLGRFCGTPLSSCISLMNDEDINNNNNQAIQFEKAIFFIKEILISKIRNALFRFCYEKKVLEAALNSSVAQTPEIMILEEPGPWIEVVLNNWEKFEHIKLCIYQSGPNDWRIQNLPRIKEDRMSLRCPAPSKWRGESKENLINITGCKNIIFVHPAGFIGGASTFEDAFKLAIDWIKLSEYESSNS